MKRIVLSIFFLLFSSVAFAAIPATAVWEVRPTNGSDLNGACVNSATVVTDYSQQDAAELALTDLATSGAGVTTITSVAGGFTSAMVGNCIRIESGTNFTLGFYVITTFTDANTIVVDRTPTAAGAGSGGAGKVGGAAKTFESATTTDLSDSLVAGNIVWVKNEAWSEAVTLTVGGSLANPIIIEGYNTTRNDDPTGANRPTNDRNAGAGDGIALSSGSIHLRNLRATEAADAGFSLTSANTNVIQNCAGFSNTGQGVECTQSGCAWIIISSEFYSNSSDGVQPGGGSTSTIVMIGSESRSNTGTGVNPTSGGPLRLFFNLFYANTADAIANNTGSYNLINNTVASNTGAATDGLSMNTSAGAAFIVNNIFANNGNYGINNSADSSDVISNYNDFFGNATAARNNIDAGANDITTDPAFVDSANGDFSVGTNMKALGYPGLFSRGASTGYLDIGAVQRQEPAGSSATTASVYVGN